MLIKIFFLLILLILTFQSHIHSTFYLYSNNNFSDILINENSIIKKTSIYSSNNFCFKINLKLKINDKITFITKNLNNNFYFAFYIIFYDSQGNYFYTNENNNNLISLNITNENLANINIIIDNNIFGLILYGIKINTIDNCEFNFISNKRSNHIN